MLTRLGLKNFKAFGDDMQYAELAPITLIYGPNSSGKSSIIQALRMLKQSHEVAEATIETEETSNKYGGGGNIPLSLITNGNLVNLGSYSSLLHNHELHDHEGKERTLEVDIAYELKQGGTDPFRIGMVGVANKRGEASVSSSQLKQGGDEADEPTDLFRTGMVDVANKWGEALVSSFLTNTEFRIRSSIAMEFASTIGGQAVVKEVGYEFSSSIGAEYKMKFQLASDANPRSKARIWRSDKIGEYFPRFIQSMQNFRDEMSSGERGRDDESTRDVIEDTVEIVSDEMVKTFIDDVVKAKSSLERGRGDTDQDEPTRDVIEDTVKSDEMVKIVSDEMVKIMSGGERGRGDADQDEPTRDVIEDTVKVFIDDVVKIMSSLERGRGDTDQFIENTAVKIFIENMVKAMRSPERGRDDTDQSESTDFSDEMVKAMSSPERGRGAQVHQHGFVATDQFIESTKGFDFYSDDLWVFTQYGIPFGFAKGTVSQLGVKPDGVDLDELDLYKSHIDRLTYFGPIMDPPQRYYATNEQSSSAHTIGVRGENVAQVLQGDERLRGEINSWLAKFDVHYYIETKSISGDSVVGNELVAIYLRHRSTGLPLTIADVGFGINQFLPIIVQGVVGEGRIICVEQPEIHLHPRMQANFADFLIETNPRYPHRGEYHDGPGNQWIVETHSEMLVRRLQRRIREGIISYEDVSVLYVDPQDDGSSTIQRLELDEDGEFLDEWPDGFFEEGIRDIMGY